MGCLSCGRFFHEECTNGKDDNCCCQPAVVEHTNDGALKASTGNAGSTRGRPPKDDATLADVHSTWRKRATVDYPLDEAKPCDWQGKQNVGGGKYPIVGCIDGVQTAIHHGPVKITVGLRDIDGTPYNFNRESNVHRICGRCHNLWHHWNDAPYNPLEWMTLPHNPSDADDRLLEQWASSKTRPKPPFPRTTPIGNDFS